MKVKFMILYLLLSVQIGCIYAIESRVINNYNVEGTSNNTTTINNQYENVVISNDTMIYQQSPSSLVNVVESQVQMKPDMLIPYSLSIDGSITSQEVQENLLSPNPEIQPTFIDVFFLQIKTIKNLFSSLQRIEGVESQNYFVNQYEYEFYLKWLESLHKYENKDEYINSLSGGVSLKDLGYGNDIILKLSSRLLCNIKLDENCSDIRIVFDKKSEYDFYSLENLISGIFVSDSNLTIGDNFINIYASLKALSVNDISGEEKTRIDEFMTKLFSQDINAFDLDDYDIGYGLGIRVNSLNMIKQGFLNKQNTEKINLLGIFNFYNEINNLTKGVVKGVSLKQALEEINVQRFFNEIAEIDVTELLDIKKDQPTRILQDREKNVVSTNISVGVCGDQYPTNGEGSPKMRIFNYDNAYSDNRKEKRDYVVNSPVSYDEYYRPEMVSKFDIKRVDIEFFNDLVDSKDGILIGDRNLYVHYLKVNNKYYYPLNSKIKRLDGHPINTLLDPNYLQRNGKFIFDLTSQHGYNNLYTLDPSKYSKYSPYIMSYYQAMNVFINTYFYNKFPGYNQQVYFRGNILPGCSQAAGSTVTSESSYLEQNGCINDKIMFVTRCLLRGGGMSYRIEGSNLKIYFDATTIGKNFPEGETNGYYQCGKYFK